MNSSSISNESSKKSTKEPKEPKEPKGNTNSDPTNDSASATSSSSNVQIINDIQALQKIEQQLFNSLEENQNLTKDQQKQIIQKINDISQMRIQLYKTLSKMNQSNQVSLNNSNQTLSQQTMAMDIIENELNESKKRLQAMEDQKNNQIRMIEINNYYSQKYAEHTTFLKIVLIMLISLIIITVLKKQNILPSSVYTGLFILIMIIGLLFLFPVAYSLSLRDSMNYQEYYWTFDVSSAPTADTSGNSNDPWVSSTSSNVASSMTCVGQDCCSPGMTYDSTQNMCISNTESFIGMSFQPQDQTRIRGQGQGQGQERAQDRDRQRIHSPPPPQFTENFVNEVLSQPAYMYQYKKPDVTLGWNPQPHQDSSFLSFTPMKI